MGPWQQEVRAGEMVRHLRRRTRAGLSAGAKGKLWEITSCWGWRRGRKQDGTKGAVRETGDIRYPTPLQRAPGWCWRCGEGRKENTLTISRKEESPEMEDRSEALQSCTCAE